MKIITGLVLMTWLSGIGYFLLYPLLPDIQNARSKIIRIDPYGIGYTAAAQFFVKLSPPVFAVPEEVYENGARVRTVEYVDPLGVEVADLESKQTRIEIPSAGIAGNVVDGLSQEEMLRGFWHYPRSSVPGKRGNTVIFGHRYHHLPPRRDTFFNLDMIKVGDPVQVAIGDEVLEYRVVEKKIVGKTDSQILAETGDYRLTLVTCTPLWTADERLVITAIQNRVASVL